MSKISCIHVCVHVWALHEQFISLVNAVWAPVIDGTQQFILKQKLTALKRPLQRLNKRHFSHISSRAKEANNELELEQKIILSGGSSMKDIRNLRARAEILMEAERLFFAQKAKCDFLNLGDRCSKFFHDLIKRNNKRNAVIALTKHDGTVTTDRGFQNL